jgi:phosphate/phosphite/phosphonate ABC transporter binding protein
VSFAASKNHGGGAEAMALWAPRFASVFGKLLQRPVAVYVADDYEQLLRSVEEGRADVSWLPPLLQSRAEAAGARMVAVTQRAGWLTYRSAVLVRRDGPYRDAASLKDVRAAWVDPFSASGYFFPRLELVGMGATFASEMFCGSPERAFAAVTQGVADLCACFVSNPTADQPGRAAEDVARSVGAHAESLRIVHVTDQIPPDGIAIGRDLDDEAAAKVTQTLVALHETEQGRDVLQQLLHADRFVALTPSLRATLRSWMDAAASRVA